MNEHDTKYVFLCECIENSRQSCKLRFTEPARGHKRPCGYTARETDQRDVAKAPHKGKFRCSGVDEFGASRIGSHIGSPFLQALAPGHRHVSIMVAGHQRHLRRFPHTREPVLGLRELFGKGDIDQIAGDRDMVGFLAFDVDHQALENFGLMDPLSARDPIEITQCPLSGEVTPAHRWQRSEVGV